MTASLGWTVAVWAGAGGGVASGSRGTGEPSRDRLSGVCTPLEWADNAPVWLGDAGALLPRHSKAGWTQCGSARHVRVEETFTQLTTGN